MSGLEGMELSSRTQRAQYAAHEQQVRDRAAEHTFERRGVSVQGGGSAVDERGEYAAHERQVRENSEQHVFRRSATGVTMPDLASHGPRSDYHGDYESLVIPGRTASNIHRGTDEREHRLQMRMMNINAA